MFHLPATNDLAVRGLCLLTGAAIALTVQAICRAESTRRDYNRLHRYDSLPRSIPADPQVDIKTVIDHVEANWSRN